MDERPDAPFRAGQCDRCRVDTLRYPGYAAAALLRTQLCGRAGTVVAVEWHTPWRGAAHWRGEVNYDRLGGLIAPRNPIAHRARELVPLEDQA